MLLRRSSVPAQVVETKPEPLRRLVLRRSPQEILSKAATKQAHAVVADSAVDREQAVKRARARIDAQLKLVSEANDKIDSAQQEIAQAYKIIEAQLRLVNISEHDDGLYRARLREHFTRQQRTIDPKRYRNKVSNDAFWGSIEVSVTKAAEFLTDKEINDIADVKPGVSSGFKLEVDKIKRK